VPAWILFFYIKLYTKCAFIFKALIVFFFLLLVIIFLGRISEKPILDTSFIIQKNILALDVFLIRRIYVVVDFCDFYDF